MINTSSVLGAFVILALTGAAWAAPAVPDAETPPVTVSASAFYYTNIAGSSAAVAAARGLKRADEVYSPAVDLNLVEPVDGGLSLFVAGQAGYDFHQRNTILDRERINLQGGARAKLSSCDATLVGSYGRYQSDLADLSVVTVKNTQEVLSEELDASCDLSSRITPSMSISHTDSDNSAILYKSSDFNSNAASAALGYNGESLGTLSIFGQYTETNYPNRIFLLGTGPRSDGYDLYAGGIRYNRKIGSKFELGLSVSETSLSTKNRIGADFSGVTYSATLAYHPTARLEFNFDASRRTVPATYLNAAYSINESYSGNAAYRISSRLTAKIGATESDSDYRGAALVPGTDLTSQTFRSVNGTLAYSVSPTLSVSLTGEEDQRHANVLGYSYSGARVGLSVSKAF
jgi:hypothetical protein